MIVMFWGHQYFDAFWFVFYDDCFDILEIVIEDINWLKLGYMIKQYKITLSVFAIINTRNI